jgi:hypothetical protein
MAWKIPPLVIGQASFPECGNLTFNPPLEFDMYLEIQEKQKRYFGVQEDTGLAFIVEDVREIVMGAVLSILSGLKEIESRKPLPERDAIKKQNLIDRMSRTNAP